MGLVSKLEKVRAAARPTFEQWVEVLDEVDRAALEAAGGDPFLPTRKLIAIVRAEGISVGEERFKEWRVSRGYPG